MAVAALDTYMHRLIVSRAYKHDKLPGGLARLDMSFEQVLAYADRAGVEARNRPNRSRPRVDVKRELRDRLLRDSFQSYDDVSRALGMAGLSGRWKLIGRKMNPAMEPSDLRARLNEVVDRRNRIVHEGDYERKERPRTGRLNQLTRPQASADIDFIAQLVDAIHAAS
jgi:hypothetical protein